MAVVTITSLVPEAPVDDNVLDEALGEAEGVQEVLAETQLRTPHKGTLGRCRRSPAGLVPAAPRADAAGLQSGCLRLQPAPRQYVHRKKGREVVQGHR